jgi:hypothetical protein
VARGADFSPDSNHLGIEPDLAGLAFGGAAPCGSRVFGQASGRNFPLKGLDQSPMANQSIHRQDQVQSPCTHQ